MKVKAFTLIEIMVALAVVLILAGLGLPLLKNTYEDANAKVCETNLLAIKTATDLYKAEHDTMPGSLSQLPEVYLNKGYAEVMKGKDAWKRKLAYFIVDQKRKGLAYASSFMSTVLKGQNNLLLCPSDTRAMDSANKISYAYNSKVKGATTTEYDSIALNEPIIVDYDSDTSNAATLEYSSGTAGQRHQHFSYTAGLTTYAQAVSSLGLMEQAGSSTTWDFTFSSSSCSKGCDSTCWKKCKGNKWKTLGFSNEDLCRDECESQCTPYCADLPSSEHHHW